MKAQKFPQQSTNNGTPAVSKEELRRRILIVVNARQHVTEVEIWRADAPNFLPWKAMQQEIEALHQGQKLRRQVVAPGNIIIHAITASPAIAPKPKAKKPATRKAPKRSSSSNKSK
jgi:hypothetical protein